MTCQKPLFPGPRANKSTHFGFGVPVKEMLVQNLRSIQTTGMTEPGIKVDHGTITLLVVK